jgi:hypothetical protein
VTSPYTSPARQFSEDLASHLTGKRLMPDVSVLLTAVLVEDSDSAALLAHARRATVLLSRHIEEAALNILRGHAPQHLGTFGDGLLRLATTTALTRIESGDPSRLPAWGAALEPEDQQVLADAIAGGADFLFVQDSAFFADTVAGLAVQTLSDLTWPLRMLDPANVQTTPEPWTFLGVFIPHWGSAALGGSNAQFYIFEVAGHIAWVYEANGNAFKLRWGTQSGARDTLTIPQEVDPHRFNFVAVAAGPTEVFWFVNGETRGKRVRIGAAPANATFHQFMSARSEHQINGGVRFRVVPKTLSEGLIRKHWRARTVRLSDREVELHDMIGPLPEQR